MNPVDFADGGERYEASLSVLERAARPQRAFRNNCGSRRAVISEKFSQIK